MEFCEVCENLLYTKVSDGNIVKFCKKCGNTLEPKSSTVVFSTSFQKREQSVVINKFTKLDVAEADLPWSPTSGSRVAPEVNPPAPI